VSAAARPRRPRRRWPRRVLVVVLVLAAFAIGVALGQSLTEGPSPGGTQTLVRTLEPLPLAPAARTTVTVTVTGP
jgi:drug/metabolite transporter (DMT)-like permease